MPEAFANYGQEVPEERPISVFICSYLVGGCEGVQWGFSGGSVGVARGLPPPNPLATPCQPPGKHNKMAKKKRVKMQQKRSMRQKKKQ